MTSLVVERAAPGLSIQDAGRFGWQKYGLGPSGAMDTIGLAAANSLVGNAPLTGAVELPLAGACFRVDGGALRFAVAGAMSRVTVDGSPLAPLTTALAEDGARIEIRTAHDGVYMYLAVQGGFDLPSIEGSIALHARAKVGGFDGRHLAAGDRLPLHLTARPRTEVTAINAALPYGDGAMRVMLGPQIDHFTDRGVATFLGSTYRVSQNSDRMGMRLEGPKIEHSAKGYNIVSDGIVTGAIQVPGSGEPIVLLADRQTTGGYPKIAHIISADLPRLSHCRPGSSVTFKRVTRNEAIAARRSMIDQLAAFTKALRPAGETTLDAGRLLALNLIDGVTDGSDQSHL